MQSPIELKALYSTAAVIALVALATGCTKMREMDFNNFGNSTGTGAGTGSGTGTGTGPSHSFALDSSWGSGGRAVAAVSPLKDFARAVSQQPSGKIIVAGQTQVSLGGTPRYDLGLIRLDSLGGIDRHFGQAGTSVPGDGIVRTHVGSSDVDFGGMALTTAGEIYVAGTARNGSDQDFLVVKYRENGTLDTGWAAGVGWRTTNFPYGKHDNANAVAVDSSGRVVVVGTTHGLDGSKFGMLRYTAAGADDPAFGSAMTSTLQSWSYGRVLTHFNTGRNQGANAVALQSDGKIVVAGWVQVSNSRANDFAIARYTSEGVLDTTFNASGTVTTDFGTSRDDVATAIAVQSDGKIVVGGHSVKDGVTDFAVARYHTNGTLDATFGSGGKVTTRFTADSYVTAVKVQPNGGVLATGYALSGNFYQFAAARYFSNGVADTGFGTSGRLVVAFGTGQNSFGRAAHLAADGSLYVAGETYPGSTQFDFAVAKLK